ncbi:hypothetical protein PT974_01780 [Cladobotryum mycophilum]|uniref:N-acetyltransferase domain-containing protein n=1 Tax=Cladobotryum mycophilum TaxID=491253 RepID=A0ABR0SW94_9HYPO
MPSYAFSFSTVPAWVTDLLEDRLPYSLVLLRRLQFTKFNDGTTPHARIIFVSDIDDLGVLEAGSRQPTMFTAAYLDFSEGPDTEMFLYSTLHADQQQQSSIEYEEQLGSFLQETSRIREEYGKDTAFGNQVLVGALQTEVRRAFERLGRVQQRPFGYYDKWLFNVHELPQFDESLPNGMYWDEATLDDCHVIVSKTEIPRIAEALMRHPNLVIRLEDKTPIAWALLGLDGSLISLHCEEAYRRKGLAKTLAGKLMRQSMAEYGRGAWGSADVSATNDGSRGMCKALNGKIHWEVSCNDAAHTAQGVCDTGAEIG